MGRDWDRLARLYRVQESLERASLEAVVELGDPSPSDRIVDLGCGPGTLARHLTRVDRPVGRLLGVDTAPQMLRRAARAGVDPILGDVISVPLADGVADLVVCSFVLHLVDDAARLVALQEVARLLQPRGRAVVVVPARPATLLGRATRVLLRHTIARGTLGVVDLRPAIDGSELVVTADHRVGSGRWGYRTRALRLALPGATGAVAAAAEPSR